MSAKTYSNTYGNTYTVLLDVAILWVDDAAPQAKISQLKTHLGAIEDWHELAEQAEQHGLSLILGKLAKEHDLPLDRSHALQLKALTLRHQKAHAARLIVLKDVIDSFNRQHIDFALLKGAALAHLIYAPAWLRPMRDIDLLVEPKNAQRAQKLLRSIGFINEDNKSGFQSNHHHLPNSTRNQDGFTISLEVHTDALSGDVDHSINLQNLRAPLRDFELSGNTVQAHVQAFSHSDMLCHLCYHGFEPANLIKLGSLVDLIRYANIFANEIDWQDKQQAKAVNTLICLNALIALPDNLITKLEFNDYFAENSRLSKSNTGLGKGFMPLSQIAGLPNKTDKLRALFKPSKWWMHIFYQIPPHKSLLKTQIISHPINIIKWLLRRYLSAFQTRKNPL